MTDRTTEEAKREAFKAGNEFAPYHPDASHVEPGYRDGWNACYRAAREADREAMRMALESLRDGRNALHELANRYHDEMRFHYPDVHASMDADVARADAAIKALEQRVGES